jgi:hypothetical protein
VLAAIQLRRTSAHSEKSIHICVRRAFTGSYRNQY